MNSWSKEKLGKLRILMLYDDRFFDTCYVMEHTRSFGQHSRFSVEYLAACRNVARHDVLDNYDAIVIHFSVRLPYDGVLDEALLDSLVRFGGPKIAMPQDEYELPLLTAHWFRELGIDGVFTTVPEKYRASFYPTDLVQNIRFRSCLTGYVGEADNIDKYALALEDRICVLAYRGRTLPVWYGKLGDEKASIGIDMLRECEAREINCDISVDYEHHIKGIQWYRFLGSARATIASESGSNVVDQVGHLKKLCQVALAQDNPPSRDEIYRRYIEPYDGLVTMNQMTPKVFEAIRLRTGLVLYEGDWSGVLQPGKHYIPLKKDLSNIDDVFEILLDDVKLSDMTERAFVDIVESGKYAYRALTSSIDDLIEEIFMGKVENNDVLHNNLRIPDEISRTDLEIRDGFPTTMPQPAPEPANLEQVLPLPAEPILKGPARVLWLRVPPEMRKVLVSMFGGIVRLVASLIQRR